MIVTALLGAAATIAVVLVVPALGTEVQVGVAPGDVIVYGPATGASGVSGVSGAVGTTGVTGATNTSPVPQCPSSCYAVSETTGFQVKLGGTPSLTVVPRNGTIVAWTISLGDPTCCGGTPNGSQTQTYFFDRTEGGAAEAGISVLKAGKRLEYSLLAQSPLVGLQPYFGQTVEFALANTIPVTKGDIIALNVPTWAPALALANAAGKSYGKFTSWRASRQRADKGCRITSVQTAQQSLHSTVQYGCLYQDARLTYSALEVTTP